MRNATPFLEQMLSTWVQTMILRLKLIYRQTSWRNRALPDFIIIGAQKSGTTSLYYYLSQHPQVMPSFKKEIHFFDGGLDPSVDNYEKGKGWYRSHFSLRKDIGTNKKTFEASPLYIFNPLVPKRIFDLIPEIKIIALLRNPTERAISHYFHEKRNNRESLSIYEALQKEEERLNAVIKEKDYKNYSFIRHSYKSRGLYKDQLGRYLKYFSWQQIAVIESEEFFSKPENTLRQVFEFVGVDPGFKVKNLKPRNIANNRINVAPDVYEYLNNYYLPHNQELYEMVGRKLWLENTV